MERKELIFLESRAQAQLSKSFGLLPLEDLGEISQDGIKFFAYEITLERGAELEAYATKTGLAYAKPLPANLYGPDGNTPAALTGLEKKSVAFHIARFLETSGTAMGRASFYNSKEAQAAAESGVHEKMMRLDRGAYGLLLLNRGATDRSRGMGVQSLLSRPRRGESALTNEDQERKLLRMLAGEMTVPRMLKLILRLKKERVNNARTRKLILETILQSGNLPLWCVKYRTKLKGALEHALGKKRTGIIRSILRKGDVFRRGPEEELLESVFSAYYAPHGRAGLLEMVGFILGVEERLTIRELVSYQAAKSDKRFLFELPFETALGMAGTFHKGKVTKKELLEKTAAKMTAGQKLGLRRTAKAEGVKIETDFTRFDLARLYVYAYEMGLTTELRRIMDRKAQEAAAEFPVKYEEIAIVLDASASMFGGDDQKLRPMATALGIRDVLGAASERSNLLLVSGKERGGLVYPSGDTGLARGLMEALLAEPQAIFIITDGYENAPAGRVAEVLRQARDIGVETPVHQLTPVFAAETGGLRTLMPGEIPATAVGSAEALATGFLTGLLWNDPLTALEGLTRGFRKKLEAVEKEVVYG